MFTLAVVPSLFTLGVALFCFGLVYGAWDVAMNVQGSTVEQRAGRAWMPRYHACWSAGGILGAAAGGLAARARVPVTVHFGLVAILGALLVFVALTTYVPDVVSTPDRSRGRLFTRRLAIVGLITLLGVTVEGAAADWLALYLVDVRHTAASVAAAGYAVFALAMAGGRFVGTPVTERLGRDGVARAGGLVLAGGIALAILGPGLALTFAGTLLWALGVCLIFPTAMSAAGEVRDHSAGAIAAVATVGYAGFLLGPPAIGLLAEHVGLGRALLMLPALGVAIAALAPAVRPARDGLVSMRDRS